MSMGTSPFMTWDIDLSLNFGKNSDIAYLHTNISCIAISGTICRNKGYATEASRALVAYGFNVFKIDIICAYIESDNTSSRRVAEKAGLRHVSTFPGIRAPELWMELRREEFTNSADNSQDFTT